jgi:hypothetical protein
MTISAPDPQTDAAGNITWPAPPEPTLEQRANGEAMDKYVLGSALPLTPHPLAGLGLDERSGWARSMNDRDQVDPVPFRVMELLPTSPEDPADILRAVNRDIWTSEQDGVTRSVTAFEQLRGRTFDEFMAAEDDHGQVGRAYMTGFPMVLNRWLWIETIDRTSMPFRSWCTLDPEGKPISTDEIGMVLDFDPEDPTTHP